MAKKRRRVVVIEDDDTVSTTLPDIDINTEEKPPKLQEIGQDEEDERRFGIRYKVDFETVIFCQGGSYRTRTLNVSISGALLKDPVPQNFVEQILDIVLINFVGKKRNYFLFRGIGLGSPLRSPRIKFISIPEPQKKEFLHLISTYPKWVGKN